MSRRLFACLAMMTFAAAALAAPAFAQGDARPEQVEIRVSFADLDLSKREDSSTLMVRILSAMEDVCGRQPNPKLFERNAAFARCKSTLATRETDARVRRAFTAALAKL